MIYKLLYINMFLYDFHKHTEFISILSPLTKIGYKTFGQESQPKR